MARIVEPTPEEKAGWDAWVASRPPAVRAIAERFDPWTLYRIGSGHRVFLDSIQEPRDGSPCTLTVCVTGEFNFVSFERRVFGIDPAELVECELPGPHEVTGSADLPIEEVRRIDLELAKLRPS